MLTTKTISPQSWSDVVDAASVKIGPIPHDKSFMDRISIFRTRNDVSLILALLPIFYDVPDSVQIIFTLSNSRFMLRWDSTDMYTIIIAVSTKQVNMKWVEQKAGKTVLYKGGLCDTRDLLARLSAEKQPQA